MRSERGPDAVGSPKTMGNGGSSQITSWASTSRLIGRSITLPVG